MLNKIPSQRQSITNAPSCEIQTEYVSLIVWDSLELNDPESSPQNVNSAVSNDNKISFDNKVNGKLALRGRDLNFSIV